MNNFQSQRLELQKEEIRIMQQSVADNKSRMKAQDGFAAANSMLEKHGHRMNETMFNHWFEIATKWATEMASFDNPSAPSGPSGPSDQSAHQDSDSPVISSDRMNTDMEDSTTMSRLYASPATESTQQRKKIKNYSSLSNSHPSGRPPFHSMTNNPPTIIESVISRRSQEEELLNAALIQLPLSAEATLEFILGDDGEPTVEYQTSVPMYQPVTVPSTRKETIPSTCQETVPSTCQEIVPSTCQKIVPSTSTDTSRSTHPFTKDPTKQSGLLRSAPSNLLKQKQQREDARRNQFNPHGITSVSLEEPAKRIGKRTSSSSSSSSCCSSSSGSSSINSSNKRGQERASKNNTTNDTDEGKREKKKRRIESV